MEAIDDVRETETMDDLDAVRRLREAHGRVCDELAKVIVGQHAVIDELLIALFAGGNCLIVGVPGLAKTLLIRTLARTLTLSFHRIQFTPDLMPSDVTGIEILQEDRATGTREYRFVPGPVFGNIVLADEINRTPPKTQSALLEAMQERQVTVAGQRHPLPDPFFVLATQNPIEQEGTYPLPEAQLDRFLFQVQIDYPDEDDELEIIHRTTADQSPEVECVLTGEEIRTLARVVRRVPIPDHVARYAMQIVRRTRPQAAAATPFVRDTIRWGAGPRAAQHVVLAAKARAALRGRACVGQEDVLAVIHPALRHRLQLSFTAQADGLTADQVLRRLVSETPFPPN